RRPSRPIATGAGPGAPGGMSGGPPPAPPAAPPPAGPLLTGPVTLEGLKGIWPDLVARARERSILLATVVESLMPTAVDGSRVALSVAPDAGHMLEGARRQQAGLQDLLGSAVGGRLEISIGESGGSARAERPKRLSEKDLRDEKLREIRARDGALDAAADALDLEIVD
ncbi:MAG: hypothetical protein SFV24_12960, partial [Gemmatimonadales bacterium]|nr:hypothetical protein [Gemmatimonadales bacterium]